MINNFLKPGLDDLCVSRTSFNWGIPVTFDKKHVVYVWVDALSNYITALGYGSEDDSLYKKYWPADVHLVGKDIIRFHTIIWPIMLMALDLPLPEKVFGHGWLLVDGGKMSKSKGNVVDPVVLVNNFGADAVRYYLLHEIPFGSDGLYNNEIFMKKINSDLANDLGNLVSRTLTMIEKYFDGKISKGIFEGEFDEDLKKTATEAVAKTEEFMNNYVINSAMDEIWRLIRRANKYIDETRPWSLAKDENQKERLRGILYNLTETIRVVSILISSFLPDTSTKINSQFGFKSEMLTWESTKAFGEAFDEVSVKRGELLFPRIDIDKKIEEFNKMKEAQEEVKKPIKPIKPEITIDDFEKIDLRVAKVLECEPVKGANKLLKLKVELGGEVRQVVSGIAKYYKPEELVGKKVIIVANLKPIKLRGEDSFGMILAASTDDDSKLYTATIDGDLETGCVVR